MNIYPERSIPCYAIIPIRLSNGKWIWLKNYILKQQLKRVWNTIEREGWPDYPTWGYRFKWKTTEKILV